MSRPLSSRLAGPAVLGILALLAALFAAPSSAQAEGFGFLSGAEGLHVAAEEAGGTPTTQAGAHPFQLEADVGLDDSGGQLRALTFHLPPGLLVNPTAIGECTSTAFQTHRSSPYEASQSGESCPNATQAGVIAVQRGGVTHTFGLFNLVPANGVLASFGASPFGTPLVFEVRLRESDYGLDLDLEGVPQSFDPQSMKITLWGTPWMTAHDGRRGNCLDEQTGGSWSTCGVFGGEGVGAIAAPVSQIHSDLTLPTTPCDQPLPFTAAAESWQGAQAATIAQTASLVGICHASKEFGKLQLMTDDAAQRTGMAFNLEVSSGGGILNPGGEALPPIKTAIATLPEGLTINPSLGAGLKACSEAQWAEETAGAAAGAGCPAGSKIGDVTLEGTLGLAENLSGAVFLAQPFANPFHGILSIYMEARLPRRGLIVKSIGKIEPDPTTGRLVATFDELPRLLYTHFALTLREGQRSALVSPPTCGAYPTGFSLADYAHPTEFRREDTSFFINHGEGGGACPAGGVPPFHPGLLSGSINPSPGAYTPFYIRMTRGDSEQEITSYSAGFPPGLLASIAGVTTCPDAAIEAAKGMSGSAEQVSPSCPASSSIGHTLAGYGVGGVLAWAPGGLYLAGPWHGAPLSVVAIDSALIGPFDLGTVVVRQAVHIDPRTAQVSLDATGSDPIPHILDGFPLHLRDIRIYVDRPGFMVNPTSCNPMSVSSTVGGSGADPFNPADDTSATSTERYQLIGCGALGFRPSLSLRLSGKIAHGADPALRAVYRTRPGDANLQAISVTLPPRLFLAQQHIPAICTRVQFAASACPAGSVIGHASAVTPLLSSPLEGNVYLRSSSHSVPDLVADLRAGGIQIEVPARIDSSHGGIRANFEGLPDGAVTSFTMTLLGARHGLLQSAGGLCTKRGSKVNARLIAQDDSTAVLHTRLAAHCPAHRRQGAHHRASHRTPGHVKSPGKAHR